MRTAKIGPDLRLILNQNFQPGLTKLLASFYSLHTHLSFLEFKSNSGITANLVCPCNFV